jgi:hypothetical protein
MRRKGSGNGLDGTGCWESMERKGREEKADYKCGRKKDEFRQNGGSIKGRMAGQRNGIGMEYFEGEELAQRR